MSALTDLIVQQTDPVTAILLVVNVFYIRSLQQHFRRERQHQRKRLRRLENELLDDNTE